MRIRVIPFLYSKRAHLAKRGLATLATACEATGDGSVERPEPALNLPRAVDHVIFDMDGILLDTERIYTEVTQQIVGRFGKVFDWSIKSRMVGRPSIESARYLVEALELTISPEEYLTEREAIFQTRMPEAQPMPGARELVQDLGERGIPMAVASSSHRDIFALKTRRHADWFALFDKVVLGDDPRIEKGKPAPDIFLLAAAEMGANPDSCLVFEDSPAGVEAALTAGMVVVAMPDPSLDPTQLPAAHHRVSALTEISAEEICGPIVE